VPPKVEEALKQYKYIPYIAITPAARMHAFRNNDEAFAFNSQGNLIAKGLDHSKERSIKFHEWLTASRVVEERITFYHGASRGAAFASHHKAVSELTSSHGWEIAHEYDISQRELAAQNPAHDLTELILSLPPGCVAVTFDISAAYRITPIHPSQQNSLCVYWRGIVYVDRA
ncbi:hypothetical protein F4604DRAFT_1513590, partial [Suillus subluteus]